ncbi:hypothetical protein IAE30_27520 [Pantoea sp. S61]|uniref:hypothetical protein n=1 Tax=Pantoea sp. S61 TaxID=2767442 RepID=UPI00190A4329|nr:hypothetical protein [Pantoea sp. S61]MBK0127494.1 hypothetical protein [Pantoea sp. S61]
MAAKKIYPVRFAGLWGTRECEAAFPTAGPEKSKVGFKACYLKSKPSFSHIKPDYNIKGRVKDEN